MQMLCTQYRVGESTNKKTGEIRPSYTLSLHAIQVKDGKPVLLNKSPMETWQLEPIPGADDKLSESIPFVADIDVFTEQFGQKPRHTVLKLSSVRQIKL